MASAKLTSKGQITIPKEIREALRVQPGDRLSFRRTREGSIVVEPETLDAATLAGALTAKAKVRGVTVEAMNEAIRRSGGRR